MIIDLPAMQLHGLSLHRQHLAARRVTRSLTRPRPRGYDPTSSYTSLCTSSLSVGGGGEGRGFKDIATDAYESLTQGDETEGGVSLVEAAEDETTRALIEFAKSTHGLMNVLFLSSGTSQNVSLGACRIIGTAALVFRR